MPPACQPDMLGHVAQPLDGGAGPALPRRRHRLVPPHRRHRPAPAKRASVLALHVRMGRD